MTELRYIVRIANKDLDGKKSIPHSLQGIKGIGYRMANIIAIEFEKKTGVKTSTKLGEIEESHDKVLEDIVLDPGKHNVPTWTLNRRKRYETAENTHLIMGDLDFELRKDLQRLQEIKSYRGLRHAWKLPVRGQRNKGGHRGKSGVVGVMKKDITKDVKKDAKK